MAKTEQGKVEGAVDRFEDETQAWGKLTLAFSPYLGR